MIVSIPEPCFQMVVDVKFHPVMTLVLLPATPWSAAYASI
jgi:hypothetical protein